MSDKLTTLNTYRSMYDNLCLLEESYFVAVVTDLCHNRICTVWYKHVQTDAVYCIILCQIFV